MTHAFQALWAIVQRELMKFLRQYGRLASSLVRPVLWLAVFAAGFRNVFGVSIVEPYDTYIPYDVYIAPGLVGMVLLLLALRWAPVQQAIAPAAGFLLTHLSLLFVPVGVGVMTHLDLLGAYGLRLLLVIVLSTWIGMAVTALVLRWLQRPGKTEGSADGEQLR